MSTVDTEDEHWFHLVPPHQVPLEIEDGYPEEWSRPSTVVVSVVRRPRPSPPSRWLCGTPSHRRTSPASTVGTVSDTSTPNWVDRHLTTSVSEGTGSTVFPEGGDGRTWVARDPSPVYTYLSRVTVSPQLFFLKDYHSGTLIGYVFNRLEEGSSINPRPTLRSWSISGQREGFSDPRRREGTYGSTILTIDFQSSRLNWFSVGELVFGLDHLNWKTTTLGWRFGTVERLHRKSEWYTVDCPSDIWVRRWERSSRRVPWVHWERRDPKVVSNG